MFSLNQKPCDFQVLFLDMDSFFASIEQQVQPPLRGQAIGIAPYTGATGCVIAASKEAKTVGVKTGMGVGEAKRIYPKIKIVEARPALYMIYHQESSAFYYHQPFASRWCSQIHSIVLY